LTWKLSSLRLGYAPGNLRREALNQGFQVIQVVFHGNWARCSLFAPRFDRCVLIAILSPNLQNIEARLAE
jgi:hypothetical protein